MLPYVSPPPPPSLPAVGWSQITAEDTKFRAAWAAASQSGGAEERLQHELAGVLAEEAAEEPKIASTIARVQRYVCKQKAEELSVLPRQQHTMYRLVTVPSRRSCSIVKTSQRPPLIIIAKPPRACSV